MKGWTSYCSNAYWKLKLKSLLATCKREQRYGRWKERLYWYMTNRRIRDPYVRWCERFSDRLLAYRQPTRLCAAHYCLPAFIVTQFLSAMYFTNSVSPFSFIISIPNLRFVRVINCPNRIMKGLYNLQSLTESNLSQSAHELYPFSMQHLSLIHIWRCRRAI